VNVEALKEDFRIYRAKLETDPIGSGEVCRVRDRIADRLAHVMTRTERPRSLTRSRDLGFNPVTAPLQPIDIRIFRHLSESAARGVDRSSVPAYWSSIPYPLQMMDSSYMLAERAVPIRLEGEAREACISWRKVRRFSSVAHPHPRLRALLRELPPQFLALPWMPPPWPWWPLQGVFADATKQVGDVVSKHCSLLGSVLSRALLRRP